MSYGHPEPDGGVVDKRSRGPEDGISSNGTHTHERALEQAASLTRFCSVTARIGHQGQRQHGTGENFGPKEPRRSHVGAKVLAWNIITPSFAPSRLGFSGVGRCPRLWLPFSCFAVGKSDIIMSHPLQTSVQPRVAISSLPYGSSGSRNSHRRKAQVVAKKTAKLSITVLIRILPTASWHADE